MSSLSQPMMRVRTGTELVQDDTPSSSPRNRVKFLCSHGGKILPRPPDGHLKYVGGETRVVAVPRHINFSDLMKRLNAFIEDGDVVLKYQLLPEDLDILVTVKSDEDLRHMLDEYDRHQTEGSPRLRAFLLPSKPSFTRARTPPPLEPPTTDHPYIDAINGIVNRSPANPKIIPITANRPVFSISSASSSPKSSSPEFNFFPHEPPSPSTRLVNRRLPFHKVRSSPTLCGLNNLPSQYDGPGNHNVQKPHYQCYKGHHSPKPPQDITGRAGHAGYGLNHYHHVQRRHY